MAESIESVMTQDPLCLDADGTLVEAAQAMDEKCIGDVLVMQDGDLCGIVTDRDIAIRAGRHDATSERRSAVLKRMSGLAFSFAPTLGLFCQSAPGALGQ